MGGTLTANVIYFDDKKIIFAPELNVFANYFIGYRTYLNANGSIFYNDDKLPNFYHNKQLNVNAGISISHILF